MEIEELLAFVSQENRRLYEYHPDLNEENASLMQTVKLNEEVGELCDAVLARNSFQRSGKLDDFSERDIENEFADVIITALLLANTIDIDVKTALGHKIETIEERYE